MPSPASTPETSWLIFQGHYGSGSAKPPTFHDTMAAASTYEVCTPETAYNHKSYNVRNELKPQLEPGQAIEIQPIDHTHRMTRERGARQALQARATKRGASHPKLQTITVRFKLQLHRWLGVGLGHDCLLRGLVRPQLIREL
ncbi:hypothetical protein DOTSEDRAFT_35146 [Dothistroma septosporum NZE10]|uniref:Uncharacterized protein n=1 Tax=Dothistroma septosporum (strain NZE10 / CBS 128990) TaxID=675120 RepID=N1PQT1_DOTSN|nr:hypothetical protein DOTSEDRAFT_35146 [Dothistroma septosporum NZE10]